MDIVIKSKVFMLEWIGLYDDDPKDFSDVIFIMDSKESAEAMRKHFMNTDIYKENAHGMISSEVYITEMSLGGFADED